MKKSDYIQIFETMHMVRFSQEYLMDIYHPEDKMKCPIHFCKGTRSFSSLFKPIFKKMITYFHIIDLMDIT